MKNTLEKLAMKAESQKSKLNEDRHKRLSFFIFTTKFHEEPRRFAIDDKVF